MTTNGTT